MFRLMKESGPSVGSSRDVERSWSPVPFPGYYNAMDWLFNLKLPNKQTNST